MKRIIWFLSGILLLITMLGLLFFSGAIYDAEKKYKIDSFFFQLPAMAKNRVDAPASASDIPDSTLREWIIARFINEYFYVIPDMQNAENRKEFMDNNGKINALRGLSRRKSVYNNWKESVLPEIMDLTQKRALRMVRVLPGFSESESGHLVVKYELTTWTKPNDVLALPEVTSGEIYLDVTREPIRVNQTNETLELLRSGVDPVAAFDFRVLDVIQN